MLKDKLSEEDKHNLLKLNIGSEILEEETFKASTTLAYEKEQIYDFNSFNVSFQFLSYKTP